VRVAQSQLTVRLGERTAKLLLAALYATRLLAFERVADDDEDQWSERDEPAWTVHWCLPGEHALAGVGVDTSRAWWEGPVPVCTLGRVAWPLLPEPVTIPQGAGAAGVALEDIIGRLATAVRMNDVTDDVYDDALSVGYGELPAYARIVTGTGEWTPVIFYRPIDCIPENFNLLNFFDPPRVFACGPMTVDGFAIWETGPGLDPAPIHSRYRGLGEVPIWFVRTAVLTPTAPTPSPPKAGSPATATASTQAGISI
jgi:hypothetical protein